MMDFSSWELLYVVGIPSACCFLLYLLDPDEYYGVS